MTREAKANAALSRAIKAANPRRIRACLARGADPKAANDRGTTALMRACCLLAWPGDEEDTTLAELLLPLSNPLATDEIGQCALMRAAMGGAPKTIALLLPFCDPLASSVDGRTALIHAAWRGNPECVRLLLPVSQKRAQDHQGLDALMIAVINDSAECIPLLLPHADLTARDREGLTAFDMARASKSPEIVALMLSAEQALCLDQTLPMAPSSPKHRTL